MFVRLFQNWFAISAMMLLVAVSVPSVCGQQIHLKETATISGSIIRLGEIAEIVGGTLADKSQLQRLELFPFDPNQNQLSAASVREELSVIGVDLLQWRLTGANTIQLSHASTLSQMPGIKASRFATRSSLRPAEQAARTAVTRAGLQVVSEPFSTDSVSGGESAGMVNVGTGSEPPRAWTVSQDMGPGLVVRESDLVPLMLETNRRGLVTTKAEIVGKVIRSPLQAGQPVRESSLETMKYVQRGKQVRIVSKVDFIEVSTIGRCLADATLGQTVAVETLTRKKPFFGTVTDFQEVTITDQPGDETITAGRIDHSATVGQPATRVGSQSVAVPSSHRLPGNPLR